MKEIKSGYYSNMPEMVAELNAKTPAEQKTMNLHLYGILINTVPDDLPNVYWF